ncbi:MAG: Gfo/Idh/MocA family protein [Jejuia sp.]
MDRRKFVKNSSLAGLGIASSTGILSALESYVRAENKAINIAVIGTGSRGLGLIPLINDIENLNITAICDVLPFRLDKAKALVGANTFATSKYKKVLNNKDIHAVLIATPFYTHGQIALDALKSGKHVYCEKTLAKDLTEVDTLVEAVAISDVIFQTGHQYHSSRLYNHVVNLIKDGEIGNVRSFECQWYRNGNWRRNVPEPKYERAVNWRMYREYSGGMTAELSSHQIDFVNWVLGENPKKIMGTGGINFWNDGRETYDNTHLIFEYPSGVKAQFKCLTSNIPGGYEIKVIGDKGIITIKPTKAWIKHYEKKSPKKNYKKTNVDGVSGATASYGYIAQLGQEISVQHLDPSKQALIDFRDAIYKGEQPISDVVTGANTAKAVNLAIEAMLSGEVKYW